MASQNQNRLMIHVRINPFLTPAIVRAKFSHGES
jgi:hypothetical protein